MFNLNNVLPKTIEIQTETLNTKVEHQVQLCEEMFPLLPQVEFLIARDRSRIDDTQDFLNFYL